MQHGFRFSFALFLVIAVTAVFPGEMWAAQKPPSVQSAYTEAAADWRTLLRDEKRGAFRDPWLQLEKRFLAIAGRDPKGDTGAKAQFQASRCREELAKRSHLTGDWRQAVDHYLALAKKYPKNSLTDDGLFQAAFIAANRLGKQDEARSIARKILEKYPKGDMAQNAREFLASLSPKTPAGKSGKSSSAQQSTRKAEPAKKLARVVCRGTANQATVTLVLDGAATFKHQYLAPTGNRSARLVIDIDAVTPDPDVKPGTAYAGLVVARVRTSVTGSGNKKGTRVVIDLGKVKHYTVDTGANPPGIHVQCSVAPDLPGGRTPPAKGKNGPVIQGRFAGTAPGRAGTIMEQLGLTVQTIMLDAGHGGKDSGAIGNGITEKHVTLSLANMLGERLRAQGFTVLYTRRKDVFITLDQRPVMANTKKADLFISLHVNAGKDKKTNGVETYFLDLARTSSAATVAARENAVSVKSISDLQFILTDLMLSSKLQESQDLAVIVHRRMTGRLRQAGFSVNDNGVRSAPFYVLMGARMPAVLVEIGYLSNKDDARRLKSRKYLERLADGITQGVVEYKSKLARFTGK